MNQEQQAAFLERWINVDVPRILRGGSPITKSERAEGLAHEKNPHAPIHQLGKLRVTAEQYRWLERESVRSGLSMAAVIRRCINECRPKQDD